MLEKIGGSEDVKRLSEEEMNTLCGEIRQELISTVSRNGGHLASNLGVVELTLALHRVFDFPEDRIVFDVGHQSYVHKMLTGRFSRFSTLRTFGGLSGFPRREESPYDCFETGHASTSISAALGLARARDYRGEKHQVMALVGDGAMTGGMCYEALNDAGHSGTRMIVILNDNEMSIAKNVGALSAHLTNLRVSAEWLNAKNRVRHFSRTPLIGQPVYRVIHGGKTLLKSALMRDRDPGFFETLGFAYFGPIDGHDLRGLEKTLRKAKNYPGPCVIHVMTRKGYGYDKAEERPEVFHGTPPFFVETGDRASLPECPSCGHVMASTLADMAETDDRIVTVTAAMPLGTGLGHFAERFPKRMIDVGIAEEHAATMAAGMAAGGMRPFFAVYSSFFQRCYDQMIHDVSMQRLSVTFLLDRSGIGGEDGQTHHGLFDLACLLPVPGMTVLAPCDARELASMLRWTLTREGPCAIRYARAGDDIPGRKDRPFTIGHWEKLRSGKDGALLAVGTMVRHAMTVAEDLFKKGLSMSVINCSSLKPMDMETLSSLNGQTFFTLEEHMHSGGFGEALRQVCAERAWTQPAAVFAVENRFLPHGSHSLLLREAGLDAESIENRILKIMERSPAD